MKDLIGKLKNKALFELSKWEKTILDNLTKYYEQTEGHVHLVEGYREVFSNSAKSLRREMENSVLNQLEAAAEIRQGMNNLDTIKKTHTARLEESVLGLIDKCRKSKSEKSDQELERDFDQMWNETVQKLSFPGLKKKNIFGKIFRQLRSNMYQKGSSVNEMIARVKLENLGKEPFKVPSDGFLRKVKQWLHFDQHTQKTQLMADNLIETCRQFVLEKVERETDYHENYILEILHMIEERLKASKDLETDVLFEVLLKLHICGAAARAFQQMHEHFIQVNDPRRCLDLYKDKYCSDFKDLFNERDQCQKKAEEFTCLCLRPAVEESVAHSLGPDIVDEMLTGKNALQFSTRAFFQYSILKHLLTEFNFESYDSYICSYEKFVKNWIFDRSIQ